MPLPINSVEQAEKEFKDISEKTKKLPRYISYLPTKLKGSAVIQRENEVTKIHASLQKKIDDLENILANRTTDESLSELDETTYLNLLKIKLEEIRLEHEQLFVIIRGVTLSKIRADFTILQKDFETLKTACQNSKHSNQELISSLTQIEVSIEEFKENLIAFQAHKEQTVDELVAVLSKGLKEITEEHVNLAKRAEKLNIDTGLKTKVQRYLEKAIDTISNALSMFTKCLAIGPSAIKNAASKTFSRISDGIKNFRKPKM